MPVLFEVELTGTTMVPATGVRTLLSRFATDPEGKHSEQDKPYRAGEVVPGAATSQWRLGWSAPDSVPGWQPEDVFGARLDAPAHVHDKVRVVRIRRRAVSFGELVAGPPWPGAARMEFRSPTLFRRGAPPGRPSAARRWWPVLDPVLVLESVARGWARWAPAELVIPRDIVDDVLDRVVVRQAQLRTRHVGDVAAADAPPRARTGVIDSQVGFVGTAVLDLAGPVPATTRAVFTTLCRFADVHGVGAQRCYGFGDVGVVPVAR
ncbi:CRISPR system precrRNA processing endoribonuclease RAMP protein Cas6 [Amycolatopsis mediterranei]|uniref:CRISPR system precrRNA processing endoribonuclease RAMP protein Cas6 n=1 Tax=Amycolatopsis mediterranei TaxID=33910 RepID=UPI00343172E0